MPVSGASDAARRRDVGNAAVVAAESGLAPTTEAARADPLPNVLARKVARRGKPKVSQRLMARPVKNVAVADAAAAARTPARKTNRQTATPPPSGSSSLTASRRPVVRVRATASRPCSVPMVSRFASVGADVVVDVAVASVSGGARQAMATVAAALRRRAGAVEVGAMAVEVGVEVGP